MEDNNKVICFWCEKPLAERSIRRHRRCGQVSIPSNLAEINSLHTDPVEIQEQTKLQEVDYDNMGENNPLEIDPYLPMDIDVDEMLTQFLPPMPDNEAIMSDDENPDQPLDQPPTSEAEWNNQQEYADLEELQEYLNSDADPTGASGSDYPTRSNQFIGVTITEEVKASIREEYKHLEQVKDNLTDEDINDLSFFVLRTQHGMGSKLFERTRAVLQDSIPLQSEYCANRMVERMTNLRVYNIDCCQNSCVAFDGELADAEECPECHSPRWVNNQRVNSFHPISLIDRLRTSMADEALNKAMADHRHRHSQRCKEDPTCMYDQLDGNHFNNLRQKRVVVNGKSLEYHYFEDERDIPFAISLDGFTFFESVGRKASKNKYSTTLIIAINLALPPETRVRRENVIILGAIPGPGHPKNLNSYLVWFVTECNELALGIASWDALRREVYLLRGYLIFAFGDMPAISALMYFKGHVGITFCRVCYMRGCRISNSTNTHYYPAHVRPGGYVWSIADLIENRRTHRSYLRDLESIQNASSKAEAEKVKKSCGISGQSCLADIPTIDFGRSFPHGVMHNFLENIVPSVVALWIGRYRDLKEENPIIPWDSWQKIASLIDNSMDLIPAAFSRRLPNIATSRNSYNAEAWGFWLVYIAPFAVKNHLPEEYYQHLLSLIKIYKFCTQLSISMKDIDQLEVECVSWVREYERLYYNYCDERLVVCSAPVHAVIHLAEDARNLGPPWLSWEFVMEREVQRAKSIVAVARTHPFVHLATGIKRFAQKQILMSTYGLRSKLNIDARRRTLTSNRRGPITEPLNDPCYSLCSPRKLSFAPDQEIVEMIALHLQMAYSASGLSYEEFLQIIPRKMEYWGKVRLSDGDTMRAAHTQRARKGCRDASFIRYEVRLDESNDMTVLYGQLQYVIRLCLPTLDYEELRDGAEVVLAVIIPCVTEGVDGAANYLTYTDVSTPGIVDLEAVKCVIGRFTFGDGTYGIIDRSYADVWPTLDIQEEDPEDEDMDDVLEEIRLERQP